ncbi:MAG: tRNA (adenosine(37)-N6)-dimethylallyltransferase MiaA [Lachnospiraceae bacterium]|nr:tRNA (adenosine(37)-N6)-dimethylallyltransferase MiaA [Lachnospiraceae bacterium]
MQNGSEKQPLVILTGPTAVGKSNLSIALAKQIGGEIISADSMQVYRHMDIGSAKISREQMQGVPHHLLDVVDPTQPFDVTIFQAMAREAAEQIRSRGKLPILVGGTGFYIQALLYDIEFEDDSRDADLRRELEQQALQMGPAYMHDLLKEVDPQSAETIPAGNVKRVIRALEYYKLTGETIFSHNMTQRQKESPYNFAYFVLTDERQKLYDAIDRRVDEMMKEGLEEEVRKLMEMGVKKEDTSMQGLGYREIYSCLSGDYPLEEAVRLIKRNTRHFAKRQLTWFGREKEVIWIPKSEYSYSEEKILEYMLSVLTEKGIKS